MNSNSQTLHLKREVLVRLIQAYLSEDFECSTVKIPYEMRPKHEKVPYRCCIHKERNIIRERLVANLGFSMEDDDEVTSLGKYAKKASEESIVDPKVLTVLDSACQACKPSQTYVTDLCQGCVARPCIGSCNFGAIRIENGKSIIDPEKCKNCSMCVKACPYHAITKTVVPCEASCPVDAIKKNDKGFAQIDFEKCISCGACISGCPFGAVVGKSQIVQILKAFKSDKKVIAMVAPSVVGQLPVSIEKIASGLIKAGFDKVYEVAQGADLTAKHEAIDFQKRMEKGDDFMTTSCCAAYNKLVEKHLPEIKPFLSDTPTPLGYIAEIAKQENAECVSVFIGPCLSKRTEGLEDDNVDLVMSFEEMGALFVAKHIELAECEDYEFETPSSTQGRNFAITGGVAESVRVADNGKSEIKPKHIDGLSKESIKELKKCAKNKTCDCGNLIEVMACPGGCIGGSATINDKRIAKKQIKTYAQEGPDINS